MRGNHEVGWAGMFERSCLCVLPTYARMHLFRKLQWREIGFPLPSSVFCTCGKCWFSLPTLSEGEHCCKNSSSCTWEPTLPSQIGRHELRHTDHSLSQIQESTKRVSVCVRESFLAPCTCKTEEQLGVEAIPEPYS